MEHQASVASTLADGVRFFNSQQLSQAEAAFCRVIELDSHNVTALSQLFELYKQQGQNAKAIDALARVCSLQPATIPAEEYLNLVVTCRAMNLYGPAETFLSLALRVAGGTANGCVRLADILIEDGRIGEALNVLRRAVRLDPTLAEHTNQVHTTQTVAYKIGRLEDLLDQLRLELERFESVETELSLSLELTFQSAVSAAREGKLAEAIRGISAATDTQGTFPEAWAVRGLVQYCYAECTRRPALYDDAFTSFCSAVKQRPTWGWGYYMLARSAKAFFPAARGGFANALELFAKALELDATLYRAHFERAFLYGHLGDLKARSEELKRFVDRSEEAAQQHPLGKLGIRFLSEDATTCIGHGTQYPDYHIKAQLLGITSRKQLFLLRPLWKCANPTLIDHWNGHLSVVTDPGHIRALRRLSRVLPIEVDATQFPDGSVGHVRATYALVQQRWSEQGRSPLLRLDENIRQRGMQVLESLGVPRDAWFVSWHAREANFKGEGSETLFARHRNCDVLAYLDAVREITAQGGWVVRMGEAGSRPLPDMERVVDYARSPHKSAWMDIFLCAAPRFFLGSSAGLMNVPQVFGVPVVAANIGLNHIQYNQTDIFVPKRLYSKTLKREINFVDLLRAPLAQYDENLLMEYLDLDFISSNAEDIRDAVREMLSCINGVRPYDAADEQRQRRYWALWGGDNGPCLSRIAKDFLRRNEDELFHNYPLDIPNVLSLYQRQGS